MIQLGHNYTLPEREEENIPTKDVGVGGAGSNALDRVVLDGMEKGDLIAMNTEVQSLASSVAACKVQLSRSVAGPVPGRRLWSRNSRAKPAHSSSLSPRSHFRSRANAAARKRRRRSLD